jgi:hypothetical protein
MCLSKYHAMKTYRGVDVYLHAFLNAAQGDGWSASRPLRFTPRAGLDAVAKRKYLIFATTGN